MGISLKDVRTTEAGAMMMRLRDQMSQMTDKTERTALALKLFGRGARHELGDLLIDRSQQPRLAEWLANRLPCPAGDQGR